LLGGCDGDDGDTQDTTQTISPERKRGDGAVIASLLDAERTAVIAYGTARRRLGGLADDFVGHERAHARALEKALVDLGIEPQPPRPQSAYSTGFPPLRSREDALRFALDVEETQIAAYGDSMPALFTPELRVTVATILGNQAEHLAVLLGELGEPQAPRDFIVGKPPE
jgi:Ferritin-like domain